MASLLNTIAQWPGQAMQAVAGMGRRLGRTMADAVGMKLKPVWPPEAHQERLRRYECMHELYEGEQKKFFNSMGFKEANPNRPYICVNLLGGLTDLLATRAYGEGFTVAAPTDDENTQAFLEDIIKRNTLQRTVHEQCVSGLPRGDKAYRVTYSVNSKRLTVEALEPERVYPEWDLLDDSRLVAANIDQVIDLGEKGTAWLWRERHELRDGQGWVVNQLFRMDKAGEGKQPTYRFDPAEDERQLETIDATAGLVPEVATGIDALLVIFQRGETAYTDSLLSLQGEYNHRVTQKSHLFSKHLPTTVFGPKIIDDLLDGDQVNLDRTRYIEREGDTPAPVVLLEWTAAGFTAVDEHLKQIITGFAFTAGVDVSTLLPDQAQAAASGTALKRQQMKTQGTCNRLQVRDEPAIAEVLSVCTKLGATQPLDGEIVPTPLEVSDLTFTWQDGLPADRTEQVAETDTRLLNGSMSVADVRMLLDGETQEDAEAAAAKITAERRGIQATVDVPGNPATGGRMTIPSVMQAAITAAQTE